MADSPKSVTDILDRLVDVGDKNDSVSIGDIVGTVGIPPTGETPIRAGTSSTGP